MIDPKAITRIHVVGAGAWGTALAQSAALAGCDVTLVARTQAHADAINTARENAAYLPGQKLDPRINAVGGLANEAELQAVMLVVPAQVSRETLKAIGADRLDGVPVILCAKGLERDTLFRQSEILAQEAPKAIPLVLSGPSFAADVAAGRPTAVTLAAHDGDLALGMAELLAGPALRPYASSDVIGVELAGALKNVYALACGAVEGAQFGLSARAAVMARAYSEMSRLIVAMGGDAATLTGLAGLGDLTLSCTSTQSRNYAQGVLLGRGEGLDQDMLAEGVKTAPVALKLATTQKVDAPLIEAVNLLLDGQMDILQIMARLMARPLKHEGQN